MEVHKKAIRKWPTVSNQQEIQSHYEECREAGTSHRAAEMFAFQQGPSLQTDTRWMSGQDNGHNGAVYKHQLARFPGDPQAWVRSRADCRAVAAKRGLTLEGSVNYKPPEHDAPSPLDEPYHVADSIVDREYEVLCDFEPDAANMPAAEVKEEIRKKLSPSDD